MIEDLLIIGLVGGIVAIDTTEFGQLMISLPIFSSVVLGYLFNNIEMGLFIGIVMVFPWLKLIPAGGALYHEGNIGSCTAAGTCLMTITRIPGYENQMLFLSIIYGIILSYTAGRVIFIKRKLNEKIVRRNINNIEQGKLGRTNFWIFLSVTVTFLSGFLFSGIGSFFGHYLLKEIPTEIFKRFSHYSDYGIISFLGLGFGIVVSMFFQFKKIHFLLTGFITGIIIISLLW